MTAGREEPLLAAAPNSTAPGGPSVVLEWGTEQGSTAATSANPTGGAGQTVGSSRTATAPAELADSTASIAVNPTAPVGVESKAVASSAAAFESTAFESAVAVDGPTPAPAPTAASTMDAATRRRRLSDLRERRKQRGTLSTDVYPIGDTSVEDAAVSGERRTKAIAAIAGEIKGRLAAEMAKVEASAATRRLKLAALRERARTRVG